MKKKVIKMVYGLINIYLMNYLSLNQIFYHNFLKVVVVVIKHNNSKEFFSFYFYVYCCYVY